MEDSRVFEIRNRLQQVQEQISQAVRRSGDNSRRVQVVVVTKSQPLAVVQAALEAGAAVLGENYPDEAVSKMNSLKEKSEVEWHMIGHVQSRKAGVVAEHFAVLHSLDSLKLSNRLDRSCSDLLRTLPVLLEVNISGEETKFGFPAWDEAAWNDLLPTFDQILNLTHLEVRGLMTMPPFSIDPEKSRLYFRRLRALQEYLMVHLPRSTWHELSMGTSADFATAVEEGATYVRIGQALLGARPA